jgi:hypothetical protein
VSKPAWRYVVGILVTLALALVIGWLAGHAALFVALAALVLLAFQARNLLRFDVWLHHRKVTAPPDMTGLWGEVIGARSSTSGACLRCSGNCGA